MTMNLPGQNNSAENPLALDNQLCFALYSAQRAMTALYRPFLAKLGITYPQYLVMLVLWEHHFSPHDSALSVKAMGERLYLDSGTLTPLLKRLESLQLLGRQRDSGDERVVNLVLTERGLKLREEAREIPQQMMCLTGATPESVTAIRGLIQMLNQQLRSTA
ncbi:organic hydroperoxide resistance transcriptional regulator [Oleiphilus messinensis]|uniref:Organic hydroperoxide resistance transcriptional regulator n=1 Tax=Oleiphilus messinensis TaxID=141451 RepID=A0A1Y0I765_9GAMM|nr:MarR family transcriptional regulator [Oleiphilus messinensis]ARU56347.1 organic hydroperoxide resistance transcriptional regulator [Oleiphilus messinensis]